MYVHVNFLKQLFMEKHFTPPAKGAMQTMAGWMPITRSALQDGTIEKNAFWRAERAQ
jgi:hypothetical protein